MKVYNDINEYNASSSSVVGIGCFDALHLGHIELIKKVISYSNNEKCNSVLIAIENYKKSKSITTHEEKESILRELGLDAVIFQRFSPAFKNQSADSFVKEALVSGLHAKCVVIGEGFRFGKDGQGNYSTFGKYSLQVLQIPTVQGFNGQAVSSTKIHELLSNDKLEEANLLLGRNFNASGIVDYGKRLASKMGYPTANIYPDKDKVSLSHGVYASYTYIDGRRFQGVSNVGINPTTDNNDRIKIETHIFDLNQDIYKKRINVEFLHRIRGEKRFANVDELFNQIKEDCKQVKKYFENRL